MSMSEVSLSLFTVMKLQPHNSPEWSSLVSGPEAKSSSEIMNPILFTVSYHLGGSSGTFRTRQEHPELWPLLSQYTCFLLYITLWCACVNEQHALCEASDKPCSAVSWYLIMTEGSPKKGSLVRALYRPANAKRHPTSLQGRRPEMGKVCGPNFPFGQLFLVSLTIL